MSLKAFLEVLESFGPYSTPAMILMAVALWYAIKQVKEERAENKGLREKRTEDLVQTVNDYRDYGEIMRNTMRDFTIEAKALREAAGG